MSDVRDILTDIGYTLTDNGKEYRTRALYRDGDNNSVLRIYKDSGNWKDFKENIAGSLEELVRLTMGLDSIEKAKEYLADKHKFQRPKIERVSRLERLRRFDPKILDDSVKDYSYWIDRGVNKKTLQLFEGGVMQEGKMKNRFIFPIFDGRNNLIGITGRDTSGISKIKWKHLGNTSQWSYPLKQNKNLLIKSKEIILIESVGDMLSLWEAGIRNSIVTFGISLNSHMIALLLKLNPNKIYIAFNNDSNKAGNKAAREAYKKLVNFFDEDMLEIKLPSKNDFGCMTKKEILEWENQ